MATDKTTKGYTKNLKYNDVYLNTLLPVHKSRTTKDNEHLFNPKSFKPKQKPKYKKYLSED